MERANAIEELTFDISFASQSTASAQHEAVTGNAQNLGTAIIDEVLDEFGVPDTILIDRLDLDLGFIAADGDEFGDRLREQLRASLRDVLAQNGQLSNQDDRSHGLELPSKVSRLDDRQVELDAVWHLLATGQLPWRNASANPDMIDSLVDRVLARDGSEIAARIGAASDPARILNRIARQWTPAQRVQLESFGGFTGLVPHPPRLLEAQLSEASEIPKASSSAEPIKGSAKASMLGPVLDDDNPLLAALFKRLNFAPGSSERAAARTALLNLMQRQPELVALMEKLEPSVLEVLKAKAGIGKIGKPADAADAQTFDEAYEFTLGLIETAQRRDAVLATGLWREAWKSGNPGAVAIEELHKIEADTARAFLRELASDPAWIAKAADNADGDFWLALLAAWGSEPADSNLILTAVITLAYLPEAADAGPSGAAAIRAALLALLLPGDGDAFQSSDLLTRLVTLVAQRHGRPLAKMARSLVDAVPETMRSRLAKQLASITSLLISEATPAPVRSNELRLEKLLAAAQWPAELWQDQAAIAPDWLAGRLQTLATSARWRDAFAAELNPDRVRLLLSLWMPQPATGPLAQLLGRPEVLQTASDSPLSSRQVYAALLAALRQSASTVSSPAQLVEAVALALAQERNIDPLALVKAILSALAQEGAAAALHRDLSDYWRDADQAIEREVKAAATPGPKRAASFPWSLAQEWTEPATGAGLTEPNSNQRDDVLDTGEAESIPSAGLTDEGRRRLYEALAPGRAAFVLGLFDRLDAAWAALGYGSFNSASDDAVLRRALFDRDAALDQAALAAAWAAPRLASLDRRNRGRVAQVIARIAGLPALPSDRNPRSGEPIQPSEAFDLPAGPFQLDWYSALPTSLPLDLKRQIAQSLATARNGLSRLRDLDEVSQRRLLARVEPEVAPALLVVDALDSYWRDAGLPDGRYGQTGGAIRLVLRVLFEQRLGFDLLVLTSEWLSVRLHALPVEVEPARLWDLVRPSNTPAPRALEILKNTALPRALRLAGVARPERPQPEAYPSWPGSTGLDEPSTSAPIRVDNAGLVLLGPYLKMLLERLELASDGQFVSAEAAERAVHVLEVLVDGAGQTLDPGLALNKLICGIDPLQPIGREFVASAEELALIESLLESVIEQWGKLGSTSVAGLREAFLQRTGRIAREDDGWRLTVEDRAIDVLVDGLPWGFKILKLPWMEGVLYVDWR